MDINNWYVLFVLFTLINMFFTLLIVEIIIFCRLKQIKSKINKAYNIVNDIDNILKLIEMEYVKNEHIEQELIKIKNKLLYMINNTKIKVYNTIN